MRGWLELGWNLAAASLTLLGAMAAPAATVEAPEGDSMGLTSLKEVNRGGIEREREREKAQGRGERGG